MNSTTISSKSRPNALQHYPRKMIPSVTASRVLTRYLGKTEAEWLDFLQRDRYIFAQNARIAWVERDGDFLYSEIGVYAYIAQCDRLALDRGIPDTPRETNRFGFAVKVKLGIDFEDGVRSYVHVDCSGHPDKPNGLTPTEARSLAKELTKAASRCKRDAPSKLLVRLREATLPLRASTVSPVMSTGDPELDELLADLT